MISNDRLATWVRIILDAALVLLITLCLLTIVLARIVPLTGRATLVVAGGSMAPAIGVGTAIVVDPIAPSSLAVGDVVSLRTGGTGVLFTHRVTRVIDRDGAIWIETKGDANAAPDPSITPASQVIGRVGIAIPGAGYLVALLSTPVGLVFVVSLGLILLLAGWLIESPAPARRQVVAERSIREEMPSGAIDAT
jgi:signal peptidase I